MHLIHTAPDSHHQSCGCSFLFCTGYKNHYCVKQAWPTATERNVFWYRCKQCQSKFRQTQDLSDTNQTQYPTNQLNFIATTLTLALSSTFGGRTASLVTMAIFQGSRCVCLCVYVHIYTSISEAELKCQYLACMQSNNTSTFIITEVISCNTRNNQRLNCL